MPLSCSIDTCLSSRHPLWLGITEWRSTNVVSDAIMFRAELDAACASVAARFPNRNDLTSDCCVAGCRRAYTAYGINPKRYAPASEALIRRAISGKPLPSINTFVDFNNIVSLRTRVPVGSYNQDAINGEVLLRLGVAD